MTDKELLLDFLRSFAERVHDILDGMSRESLSWQPDEEANNIAVTVWHFCRAFDVLKVRVLENRSSKEELWYTRGWAAKTGYDPSGIGWGGLGNLAGYTQDEVKAVPILSADQLVTYFDQVCDDLCTYIAEMSADALYAPAPGWPAEPQTGYETVRNFLMDALGHLGEIRAINAMWERRTRSNQRCASASAPSPR